MSDEADEHVKSIIKGCLIVKRTGDPSPLFRGQDDGSFFVKLHGYAIVPLEDFKERGTLWFAVKRLFRRAGP